MDFRKELNENSSKKQISRICYFIGEDPVKFNQLMKYVLKDDECSARASWAAMHAGDGKQDLLNPWFGKIIGLLKKTKNSSVKRNLLRILENVNIPNKYQGKLYEISMRLLLTANEPIAVRTFAITVLYNIAILHPDLISEFKMVLSEILLMNDSPAIQSRGKKSLNLLTKTKY